MGRLFILVMAITLAAAAAYAQEPSRVFPGFEKVYKDSKKKEAEAMRSIAAAQAEIVASDALRIDGERQIADADAAIQSQQLAYLTLTRGFGAALTAREARAEAAQLEASARAWADAEERKEKGAKTVLAANAQRAKASDRLAEAELKLSQAQIAIARTLQDGSEAVILAPARSGALAPRPVDTEPLPPAAKEEAALPVPASVEPPSPLDRVLLGGPSENRP